MAHHTIFCVGFPTDDPNVVEAPAGLNGETDLVTVPAGETAGVISAVGAYMGILFENLTPAPGDTIAVTGPVGQIPDYQTGMFFSVNADGTAYFPNAGHLSAAFSE